MNFVFSKISLQFYLEMLHKYELDIVILTHIIIFFIKSSQKKNARAVSPKFQGRRAAFPSLLTLLFTSLSLGRMSRVKPSAWPLVRLPPFMKFPKARIRPRTRFTVSLSCSVCKGDGGV